MVSCGKRSADTTLPSPHSPLEVSPVVVIGRFRRWRHCRRRGGVVGEDGLLSFTTLESPSNRRWTSSSLIRLFDSSGGQGLTNEIVGDVDKINEVMDRGFDNRTVGATLMNAGSSRSHSIFTVVIEMSQHDDKTGKDNFCMGKVRPRNDKCNQRPPWRNRMDVVSSRPSRPRSRCALAKSGV